MKDNNYSDCLKIEDIRIDGMSADTMSVLSPGIVIGSRNPAFSWRLSTGIQHACRVTAASATSLLESPDIYDSGWCITRNSLAFPCDGSQLKTLQQVFFRIEVELTDGRRVVSEPGEFTVGLLEYRDWQAKWIYADGFEHFAPAPLPFFRRAINIRRGLQRALVFSAAKGLLELSCNGSRIDEHDFLPGWSNFSKELQYTAYNITNLLHEGSNILGAILADGWFIASFPGHNRNQYGTVPAFKVQLELQYEDGSTGRIISDSSWRWHYDEIISSDIYDGENCNPRLHNPEWQQEDFDDTNWRSACEQADAGDDASPLMTRKLMPGVRQDRILSPVSSRIPTSGIVIYDFGEVITGRIRLRFNTPPNSDGVRARVRYAEVLNPDGTLYNVNFRNADNLDTCVTVKGHNDWETHFTFHGFRYVQLEGLTIPELMITELEIEAIVLTSDLQYSGTFECGMPLLNTLADNIRRSMQGNLLEIPMDCPQRDERLGWTGDTHMFFQTAMFLADGRNFYRKYLNDLRLTQRQDGAISSVAPVVSGFQYGSAGWADALPIITWELFCKSGDIRILQENYDAIKKHLAYELSRSEALILVGHLDHLSLAQLSTDPKLIGTVFFYHTALITSRMAKLLGQEAEAAEYRQLTEQIRLAFRRHFLTEDGVLKEHTQCAFALLFYFNMLDSPEEKKRNAEIFGETIRRNGNHLNTGFIGTAYLCPALAKAGLSSVACELVLQREFPSWLFEVENGATTIWERWDSWHPEKGFATPLMNSFNHYANGAVGEFLFCHLAGIFFQAADESGDIAPVIHFNAIPEPRIGYAATSMETPCGKAACKWRLEGNRLCWQVTVPPNTTGILEGPGNGRELPPGTHELEFSI